MDRRQFLSVAAVAVGGLIVPAPSMRPFASAVESVEKDLYAVLAAAETSPVTQSLEEARGICRRARSLLRAGTSASQRIDALRLSGRCDIVRGNLAWQSGNASAAKVILDAGYIQCREAGDAAGQGLARDRLALMAMYAGRPDEAVGLARDGARTVGTGPMAARLASTEAVALSKFITAHNRDVERAADKALMMSDELAGHEQAYAPGLWFDGWSPFEAAQYASATYAQRGLLTAARSTAAAALHGLEGMGAVGYIACTQLNLAIGLVRTTGRLGVDEACELADAALTKCARRPEEPVAIKAADFALLARERAPGADNVRRFSMRAERWAALKA